MLSPDSTCGPCRLSGWGVEVRLPGRRPWRLLTKPGQEEPLCTHLEGARAWAQDYERRGCQARLVALESPRGRSYRERPPEAPVVAQLSLID